MSVELDRVGWEDGTLVSPAKVNVDGTVYEVEPEVVTGTTPTSAENLKKMENNTEKGINEGILDANTYSTTETRIGTYLGKPLYRKVVELGNLPDGTVQAVKTVSHGLTNFKIIKAEGTAWRNDNAVQYPLPFVWHSNDQIEFLVSDTNITIYTSGNKSDFTGQMILEYIKTTD